jgi:hypothetical protein
MDVERPWWAVRLILATRLSPPETRGFPSLPRDRFGFVIYYSRP